MHHGSLRHFHRREIAELPVEIVIRDAEDRFLSSIGIFEDVRHVLAAKMHVRHQVDEFGILQERDFGWRAFPVADIWRNSKVLRARRRARKKRKIPALWR